MMTDEYSIDPQLIRILEHSLTSYLADSRVGGVEHLALWAGAERADGRLLARVGAAIAAALVGVAARALVGPVRAVHLVVADLEMGK